MMDDQEILRLRADVLRGNKGENTAYGESHMVVAFLLAPERYAIESVYVSEVLTLDKLTVIPGAPSFITGVINLRGKIISIVNLKMLFNLKISGITQLNKIIVLKWERTEFGIVTDEIEGTFQMCLNSLSVPPSTVNCIEAEYIKGITPDGIIMLNAEHILTNKALIVNQNG
jgi:purine-binding chemotaxis protein CheW